jgi:hypothetical protein
MNDSERSADVSTVPAASTCAQCDRPIDAGEAIEAGGRRFCAGCYAELRTMLERAARASSVDVNYPMAAVGAMLGGAAGALVWWGFTVLTHVAFGLVAVAIGYLAGHGAVRLAGNKRTVALQGLAATLAAASFFVASYLVNMTLINEYLAKEGKAFRIGFPPGSLAQGYQVVATGFGIMDVVFLFIVVQQAWSIPRPLRIPRATSS